MSKGERESKIRYFTYIVHYYDSSWNKLISDFIAIASSNLIVFQMLLLFPQNEALVWNLSFVIYV